jgi:hypothetical protein
MDDLKDWTDNLRQDGAEVIPGLGRFCVVGPNTTGTRWVLTECPCCGLPFKTKRNAQLAANAVYPWHDLSEAQ